MRMKKQSDLRIYSENDFLVIDDYIIREKIRYRSVENVIIYYVGETYNNQIDFYLNEPVIYENINLKWWSKLFYKLFLITHSDKYKIEISYSDDDILLILKQLEITFSDVSIPNDLNNSMLWKTLDSGFSIPGVKLIYSKLNLGLYGALVKYNKFKSY